MKKPPRHHIGIVGCSAEGAALCYRTICHQGAELFGRYAHPEVSLHTHSLADYMVFIENDDWRGVGDLMLSSAKKLHAAGAKVLICPDNTIHQAFEYVRPRSPLPWLHIAEVALTNAKESELKRLGILGTRYLMEGPVYREACTKAGIEYAVPDSKTRKAINEVIFSELVNGVFTTASRDFFHVLINDLKKNGCDGVILGCTEIPLIVDPKLASLPTFDSTRLLARAALEWFENPEEQ